jgi:hypothetical protein
MKMARRQFIKLTAATGGAFAITSRSTTFFAEKSVKPLRILILGGTGFTGPYQVRYALSREHKMTTFNRGKTHPGELPDEVEQLIGDRNGKLEALKDRQWDVVIDNPTTFRFGCVTRRSFSKATSSFTSSSPRFRFTANRRPVRTKQHRQKNTKALIRTRRHSRQ